MRQLCHYLAHLSTQFPLFVDNTHYDRQLSTGIVRPTQTADREHGTDSIKEQRQERI